MDTVNMIIVIFLLTGDVKYVYDTDTPDESGNWGPYEMAEQGCSRTCGWVHVKPSKLGPFEFLEASDRTIAFL